MITLGPDDTLSGSSPASVTCTITGDSLTNSVDDFRVLYQGDLTVSPSILIDSGLSQRLVKSISIANDSSLSVNSVKLFVGSGRIITLSIPAGGMALYGDFGWRIYDAYGDISSGAVKQTIEHKFSYGDATPSVIFTSPAGRTVLSSQISVLTAFNGSGAALTLGDATVSDRLISASENDPATVATYETDPLYTYITDTQVLLSITPGSGASQGNGIVHLELSQ